MAKPPSIDDATYAEARAVATTVLAAIFLHARISNPQQTAQGEVSITAAFEDAENFFESAKNRANLDIAKFLVEGPP
jgi:hypothetical protein